MTAWHVILYALAAMVALRSFAQLLKNSERRRSERSSTSRKPARKHHATAT